MSSRLTISSERNEPVQDNNTVLVPGQTAFPALSVPPQPAGRDESSSTSRFRRITKIPSWVRGRTSEASTSSVPSAPRRNVRDAPRPTQSSFFPAAIQIPPAPSSPPPSLPIHPRASRLSFGVGTVFVEPRRQSASLTGTNPPQYPPLSPSDPRRRSLSSPTLETHRFRHSNTITPRPPIVSSSWDDNKLPSKHHSLPPFGPSTSTTPRSGTSSSASTTTAASSQDYLPHLDDFSLRSGPPPAIPVNEGRTGTIPKLDFVSHFEAITQLNLKMESEELLTAEELGRALKYLFSRYHGVLDSVGEFKAQLDGENAELRAQINALQLQLQNNNAEVLRLKSLLAEHGISGRVSSESTDTVRGPSTLDVRRTTSPSSSHHLSGRVPGSPGPPPTMSLPPIPPLVDQDDFGSASIDVQRYVSRVPPAIPRPALYGDPAQSDNGEPRAI